MSGKAVFFDRDGTLIKEKNYISRLEDIEIFETVPSTLKILKQRGYLLIVITNQSGVARGYFEEKFVLESFQYINSQLRQYDIQLDEQFYCPHHLQGQPPYNISCNCRKPAVGLLDKAYQKYQLEKPLCFFCGDKFIDIQTAVNFSIPAGLVMTGYGKNEQYNVQKKFPSVPIFEDISKILKVLP